MQNENIAAVQWGDANIYIVSSMLMLWRNQFFAYLPQCHFAVKYNVCHSTGISEFLGSCVLLFVCFLCHIFLC